MSFGRDLEAHLHFYVECRANFANLDAVLDTLVMGATRCAMPTQGPRAQASTQPQTQPQDET